MLPGYAMECHPKIVASPDLEAEQEAFFNEAIESSAKLVKSSNPQRPQVLSEVVERSSEKKVAPPTPRPAPQPKLFRKPAAKTEKAEPKVQVKTEEAVDLEEISRENERLLESMSKEEIFALQQEMYSSIPESFLEKLNKKGN